MSQKKHQPGGGGYYYDGGAGGSSGGGHQPPKQQPQHWESTKSGNKYPETGTRSSYHLYAYPGEVEQKWTQVSQLTQQDGLGYMSSRSPRPMYGGAHKGAYTISVHKDNGETGAVRDAIASAGLEDRIFKHSPIVPREDANSQSQSGNGNRR